MTDDDFAPVSPPPPVPGSVASEDEQTDNDTPESIIDRVARETNPVLASKRLAAASPIWCGHRSCGMGFWARYRNHGRLACKRHEDLPPPGSKPPSAYSTLIAPLLTCKIMYQEASESMFLYVEFLFENLTSAWRLWQKLSDKHLRRIRANIQVSSHVSTPTSTTLGAPKLTHNILNIYHSARVLDGDKQTRHA